jgi:hypothetical protein
MSNTIALFHDEDRQVAHYVSLGSLVHVKHSLEGNRRIEVVGEGQTVWMFPENIRARGERVPLPGPT